MDPIRKEIAHRVGTAIRENRRNLGISQEKLAQRADISQETVRRLEAEESTPDLPTLAKLAQALGMKETDLLVGRVLRSKRVPLSEIA